REPLRVQVTDPGTNRPLSGLRVAFEVFGGGGAIDADEAVTDAGGFAETRLTAGRAPVRNRVRATVETAAGARSARFDLLATPGSNVVPEVFATLKDPSSFAAIRAEDLAFDGGGRIFFGNDGGVGFVETSGTEGGFPTTGVAIQAIAGIAFDAAGALYGADGAANRFVKIAPDGAATALIEGLDGGNFAAVDREGNAYLSTPCEGRIYQVTPAGEVSVFLEGPLPGGAPFEPNGFAFGEDESELWIVTENTGFLCRFEVNPAATAKTGKLLRVPLAGGEPGAFEIVEDAVGTFGDGVAFDSEGNLYAIFDQVDAQFFLGLPVSIAVRSEVWARTPEGDFQRWFFSEETIWANLAFGEGEFARTDLYLTEFLPGNRIFRTPAGIPGLPLIPRP
ncbi:MAG: hypothetical protein K8I02_10850, partial [Candidatus Methylomirabilis sp.]|nr:hypothetical protein [Deltaproteobacteria bacterium]